MNGTFYEQLGCVAGMFDQWGDCERTVIACALAKRVPWPGLRLVQRTVEAALQNHVEDERLERDANDETHIASLLAARGEDDDEEDRLRQLLTLLPLMRVDNTLVKGAYMVAAPTLVRRCVDAPRRSAPDLCRQLLSYLVVHPALTHHDQTTLTQWLRYLENHMAGNRPTDSVWQQSIEPCLFSHANIWGDNSSFRRTIGKNIEFKGLLDSIEQSIYTDILQESFSKNGRDVDLSVDGDLLNFDPAIAQPHGKSQRSNSLTPPSTIMHMSSSAENLNDESFVQKPRSFSLSSEHSFQLRPMIMYGTTGSETRLDDLRLNNFTEHPGMSTVGQWLKSLRLHKYVWLFTNITYEQMMAIDEEYLEKLGVTKGARHKILLSIKKLHERSSVLESVRAELSCGTGSVLRALERLRGVLLSPMPPSCELPAAVVTALDLASKCMGSAASAEDPELDPMSLHCWLVEKALHHASFRAPELQAALRRLRHRLPPRQFFHHVSDMPPHRRNKPRWRAPQYMGRHIRRPWYPRGKSNSYPPFPPVPPGATLPGGAEPPGAHIDYSGLDALCLQMTEQAIN